MVMSNHHRIIAIKLFFTLLLACAGTNCMAIDIHPALLIKPNTKYYIYNNHYNRFLCTRNDREGFAGPNGVSMTASTIYSPSFQVRVMIITGSVRRVRGNTSRHLMLLMTRGMSG